MADVCSFISLDASNVPEMDLNAQTKCRSRSVMVYGSRQGAS